MSVRTDYLNLVVNVNGNAAKKDYYDLKSRAAELNKELQGLKKGTKEFIDKTKELQDVNARIDSMRGQMDLASLSIKDLRKEIQSMKAVRDSLDPASDAFKNLSQRISGAETRLRNLQGTTSLSERAFNFLKKEVMAFGMVALAAIGFDYLIGKIGNLIQKNADLSDSFADVARYTNMADDEVKELYNSFKYIDTRTPRKELLNLASEAGKLGINGKKNIEGFVIAANKIKVALGEDLGQDAILKLTKLNNVFKISEKYAIDTGEALTKTGSVLNKLGAESAAAESFLLDFMTRTGPIGSQANFLITQIAGIASATDELGFQAEVSSTVFNQIVPKMFSDTAAFAKVAKMSTQDFTAVLKKDANEALLLFLKGLQGNNEGMAEMAEKFKDIEIDGTRGFSVIAAWAANIDKIKKAQSSANDEFKLAISIQDEYNKRNTNFAASIEKIQKGIAGWFTNSSILAGLESMAKWMEKIFNIPLSRKLEEERQALSVIEIQLNQTNLSQEERTKLYKKIIDNYPEYFKGMDKEKISYKDISNAIKQINSDLINKIALQKNEEQLQEAREKAADALLDKRKVEIDAMKTLSKLSERYNIKVPQGKDALDQTQKFFELYKENVGLFNNSFQESSDLKTLSVTIERLKSFKSEFNELQKASNQMQKDRDQLAKDLGIDITQKNETSNEPTSPEKPVPPPPPAEPDDKSAEIKTAKENAQKALNDLKKHIDEMEREQLLSTLDANEKELQLIYDKYQKEIDATAGHSEEIKRIEKIRNTEYFATKAKQDQEAIDKKQKLYDDFLKTFNDFKDKETQALISAEDKQRAELKKKYLEVAKALKTALEEGVIDESLYKTMSASLQEMYVQAKADLEEKLRLDRKAIRDAREKKGDDLDAAINQNPFSSQDEFEAEKQRIADHYADLAAQEKAYYESEKEAAKGHDRELEKIEKEHGDRINDIDAAQADAQAALDEKRRIAQVQARIQGYNALASATIGMINMLSAEQQKYTKAQKAATILQLSMDTASAIGSLVSTSAANKLNSTTMGVAGAIQFAAGLVQIMTNIGMAMKVLSSGTVPNGGQSVNQKAEGGYTTVQGADDRENYRAKMLPRFENGFLNNPSLVLAGEKGPEYFVNNDMLQNPDVAQIVAGIEALSRGRISQVDFSQMLSMPAMQQKASGGYTSPSFSTSTVSPVPNNNDTMLLMVAESLAKLNKHLDEGITSNAFIGDPTIIEFQKRQSYLSNIEKEAN